jgi:O-acetyl-ADP-ribose deacetylase (regulator of RNase III)
MIHYTETTVFNVNTRTIVNTINCAGVMGDGIALEFRLRYPEMFEDYVRRCKRKEVVIGKPYVYRPSNEFIILNFPTKKHWRYQSKVEWIEQGLDYFVGLYRQMGIASIAFPPLGCNRGGLDWRNVKPLMERYLGKLDIDVYICLDREKVATGVEGEMVATINDLSECSWINTLGLRDDIAKKILAGLPICRFRDLRRIKGVGKKTYEQAFLHFYALAKSSKDPVLC